MDIAYLYCVRFSQTSSHLTRVTGERHVTSQLSVCSQCLTHRPGLTLSRIFLFITIPVCRFFFFFFNNPAPPEISPFPLHDAFPISEARCGDTACRLGKSMNITWRIGPTFESTCHDSTKPQEGTVWKSAFDLAAPRPLYWRESK